MPDKALIDEAKLDDLRSILEEEGITDKSEPIVKEPVEVAKEEPEEVVEEEDQEPKETAELSEEELAKKQGWNPEGEYSAGEFLRRGELLDAISKSNKRLKSTEDKIDALVKLQAKTQQYAESQRIEGYKQGIAAAEAYLEEIEGNIQLARELEDADRVSELYEEKFRHQNMTNAAKAELAQMESVSQEPTPQDALMQSAAAKKFVETHRGWIEENSIEAINMKQDAEMLVGTLLQKGADPDQIVDVLTDQLGKKYPHRFKKEASAKRVSPEGEVPISTASPRQRQSSKTQPWSSLSREEQDIGYLLIEEGVYKDKNDYLKHLDSIGDMK